MVFLSLIFNDEKLVHPIYCPNITSEEYTNNNQKSLPLIYIWNENLDTGSFTVSVNGYIVGYLLEAFCSRDNPDFKPMKDQIMAILSETTTNAIVSMCEQLRTLPSKLFTK